RARELLQPARHGRLVAERARAETPERARAPGAPERPAGAAAPPGAPPEAAHRHVAAGGGPGARVRRLVAACLLLAAARGAGAYEEPVSAFAASVGARDRSSGSGPGLTGCLVPQRRTFLLAGIPVPNHGPGV